MQGERRDRYAFEPKLAPSIRRDLNQAVFQHIYVIDDEVIASDLTPTFQRLLSQSLPLDLQRERKPDQSTT